jgi:NAD(P)-dependent dehydrogenase (short-subunit alcohol dehydrogenase family)
MSVALVTGAARRIGRAIATTLAARGLTVLVHYHRSAAEAEALAATLQQAGHVAYAIGCDLADLEAARGLCARGAALAGAPVTVLVNNASRFVYDDLASATPAAFRAHLDVNVGAPLFLAQGFAAQLPPGAEGVIVNLLDQKVGNPNPDYLTYSVGKAALAGLTPMLALALAPRIRVVGIAPGITLPSDGQDEAAFRRAAADTPLGRSSTPDDLARGVAFVLDTPSLTGQILTLDGGESISRRRRDVALDPSTRGSRDGIA